MDFSLALLIGVAVTGAILLWYRLFAQRSTRRRTTVSGATEQRSGEPWLVECARTFFPVVLLVLLLRSFVVEPFRIPSGSMLPSLHIGDFILVNKYAYGLRLPVVDWKVTDIGMPKRGDVMVFRFPRDQSLNYIKRVVGLPGDHIRYIDKTLLINDERVPSTMLDQVGVSTTRIFSEQLGERRHRIQRNPKSPAWPQEIRVPEGHYFVMGDNRDNSHDSRVWGFVPETHIVGKAFFIWFSWDNGIRWSRIGDRID